VATGPNVKKYENMRVTVAAFLGDSHSIVDSLAICIAEEHFFFAHYLGPLAWIFWHRWTAISFFNLCDITLD
jgi:hypothetical protein